jgi:hypothetical protein
MMPMPTAQFRLGIYKNTDLIFRYVPTLTMPGGNVSGKIGLWGIGFMHDFKQWIPGLKERKFDMAIQAGYTKFKFGIDFPNALNTAAGMVYADGTLPTSSKYADQGFDLNVTAWNINALISKKLLFLTLYGGLGYSHSKTTMGILGTYPIPVGLKTNPSDLAKPNILIEDKVDPIELEFTNGSPRVTAGLRFNILWILTLHAEYTYASYPIMSAGLGLTIR